MLSGIEIFNFFVLTTLSDKNDMKSAQRSKVIRLFTKNQLACSPERSPLPEILNSIIRAGSQAAQDVN